MNTIPLYGGIPMCSRAKSTVRSASIFTSTLPGVQRVASALTGASSGPNDARRSPPGPLQRQGHLHAGPHPPHAGFQRVDRLLAVARAQTRPRRLAAQVHLQPRGQRRQPPRFHQAQPRAERALPPSAGQLTHVRRGAPAHAGQGTPGGRCDDPARGQAPAAVELAACPGGLKREAPPLFERAGGGRRAGVPGGQDDLERANTDYRPPLGGKPAQRGSGAAATRGFDAP